MTTPYRPTAAYVPTRTRYTSSSMPLAPIKPRLVAEVYRDPYFQGPSGIVISNVPFTADIGFQDNISSVKVYRGPGYATNPNHRVIFHEHRDFRGRQIIFSPGYYPNLHDMAFNFGDMVSSISFGPSLVTTGPDFGTIPLMVEVYQHVNFQGKKVTVLRDISHTNQIELHDAISSIRVFRGPNFPPSGCKAIFYEHIEFDGQALEIPLGPLEYNKELPDLHLHGQFFGDIISSIKLESWVAGGSGYFREVVFLDEFDTLRPVWQWLDPKGDSIRELIRPQTGGILRDKEGWLEIHMRENHDLWWGPDGRSGNMDAPRMLQEISGDFAIEVKLTSGEQRADPRNAYGGILVWKTDWRFLRLDKTSNLHAFRGDIRFEAHIQKICNVIGRGKQSSVMTFLRLERTGHQFQAYCSVDGQNWQSCGTTTVVMRDPVRIGMHALCPGATPPTTTRFDYFKIIRPGATTTLGLSQQLPSYGASSATTQTPRR